MDMIRRNMTQIKTLKGLEKQVQINKLNFQEAMLNGYISNLNFVLFKQSRKYQNYTKPVLQKSYLNPPPHVITNIWHDSIKAHMLSLLCPTVFNCAIILNFFFPPQITPP